MKGNTNTKASHSNPDYSEMEVMMQRYIQHLESRNYSKGTQELYRRLLKYFCSWCEERGIERAQEVTRSMLERYQRWLYHFRTSQGRSLSAATQGQRLTTIRMFFSWMSKANYLLYNPASELELPRRGERLPQAILSHEEVERIMQEVNLDGQMGFRDRAMLETLYSTGIRRAELCNLEIADVDTSKGTLMVRQGKNSKDRLIPIGERALVWIEKYLCDLRPLIAPSPDNGILFITRDGCRFNPSVLTQKLGKYLEKAGIEKPGSCHIFRHSMATAMLENGADIRFIQEILGHKHLDTTQIYTRVSIAKLKEVHSKSHPGARFKRKESPGTDPGTAPGTDRNPE